MTYHYIPSPFMLPTSRYDEKKADRAVTFIQNLCHTKGRWAGQKFLLLPWQEQIVRDLFGIVKKDGNRQFLTAYVEIPKKNGKSELAAAIALYLLYADGEASAEVYGAACDRNQASIVFDVAKQMVLMSRALEKRSKVMGATKRIINYSNAGFYQVLSAETGTKHGLNVSGLVFDEIHAQPNRHLYDVLTKGSGDAREQPLFFIITTAGNDKNSICYELHTKALEILKGRKKDGSFYPVVYGLSEEEDWNDEENWLKANPSLGHTIGIDRVREAYLNALDNPAEENVFKQLRLNIWTNSAVTWIPEHVYDKGSQPIDVESLKGRDCYAGLDLSSTSDITAFVLIFPPRHEAENYQVLPFFWLPEDTLVLRSRRDHVLYDVWEKQGFLLTTEGNVVHYGFIERFIEELSTIYHIREIAYDRWNATQMVQNLEGMGLTMVPFGQGYKDMSPPSKEFYKLMMEGKIQHGGHPVLKWMAQNVVMRQDPAGNIKPDKEKSIEKIDGIVATIMALDRCIRHQKDEGSIYDERGILSF
ncbi:terminase large subunit [Streptococcus sp.]|uniref:terminase large subunit n=1 Tax=Streptococcus sp. TaxID=1306 RepID=UPI0026DC67CD|nr:terminase TerL endonuclease subunit [Streptococcus sp.]MDO4659789.1 terminase large subunit [Streptococcus sp.]